MLRGPSQSKCGLFNISNDLGLVKGHEVFGFVVSDTRLVPAPKVLFLCDSYDCPY